MSVLSLAPLPTLMLVAIAALVVAGGGASVRIGDDEVTGRGGTDPLATGDAGVSHVDTDGGARR